MPSRKSVASRVRLIAAVLCVVATAPVFIIVNFEPVSRHFDNGTGEFDGAEVPGLIALLVGVPAFLVFCVLTAVALLARRKKTRKG